MNDQTDGLADLLEAGESKDEELAVERVIDALESDRGEIRKTALEVLYRLSRENTDRVVPVASEIVDRLDDPYLVARSMAAMTLVVLARERPDAVEPALPRLVELLEEDPPLLRFRAAGAVAPLTESHPEAFVDHVDDLVDVLTRDLDGSDEYERLLDIDGRSDVDFRTRQDLVRGIADERTKDRMRTRGTREVVANALVEVARVAPDACASRILDLKAVIESDVPSVRAPTIDIVRFVAEAEPSSVEPAVDVLVEALDDDVDVVRARAIRALGFAEATAAVPPLRSVAESDPNDDVADMAAETARWLADDR